MLASLWVAVGAVLVIGGAVYALLLWELVSLEYPRVRRWRDLIVPVVLLLVAWRCHFTSTHTCVGYSEENNWCNSWVESPNESAFAITVAFAGLAAVGIGIARLYARLCRDEAHIGELARATGQRPDEDRGYLVTAEDYNRVNPGFLLANIEKRLQDLERAAKPQQQGTPRDENP